MFTPGYYGVAVRYKVHDKWR